MIEYIEYAAGCFSLHEKRKTRIILRASLTAVNEASELEVTTTVCYDCSKLLAVTEAAADEAVAHPLQLHCSWSSSLLRSAMTLSGSASSAGPLTGLNFTGVSRCTEPLAAFPMGP